MARKTIHYTMEINGKGNLNIYEGNSCFGHRLCWSNISPKGAVEVLAGWVPDWVKEEMAQGNPVTKTPTEKLLKNLYEAFSALEDAWDEDLDTAYPFDKSFDEVAYDVGEWFGAYRDSKEGGKKGGKKKKADR